MRLCAYLVWNLLHIFQLKNFVNRIAEKNEMYVLCSIQLSISLTVFRILKLNDVCTLSYFLDYMRHLLFMHPFHFISINNQEYVILILELHDLIPNIFNPQSIFRCDDFPKNLKISLRNIFWVNFFYILCLKKIGI